MGGSPRDVVADDKTRDGQYEIPRCCISQLWCSKSGWATRGFFGSGVFQERSKARFCIGKFNGNFVSRDSSWIFFFFFTYGIKLSLDMSFVKEISKDNYPLMAANIDRAMVHHGPFLGFHGSRERHVR